MKKVIYINARKNPAHLFIQNKKNVISNVKIRHIDFTDGTINTSVYTNAINNVQVVLRCISCTINKIKYLYISYSKYRYVSSGLEVCYNERTNYYILQFISR